MAANQVTVATPGPAGATGLVYEGVWASGEVYQVRDLVRFTDGNLYVVNTQHTSSSSNTPTLNASIWSLFINADDAFQWATKVKHTQITDSLSNTGYSALHQAAKAQDWASLTTDAVTNDANASDVDYSAKAWAIGGTEVTTTNLRGAAKEWATTTNGLVDTAEYSAKAYAIGGTGITNTSGKGAAKEWAIETSGDVDGTSFSAKEYAQGTQASTGGSAKDWSQDTNQVNGATTNDRSAKAWSQGTSMTGATLGGSSKDWASLLVTAIDGTLFSSKEYAQGVTASTGGSAKDYATYVGGGVRGATSDHSAKAWAVGGTGVTTTSGKGSAIDWATKSDGVVDTAEFSAKAYASVVGTHAPTDGSAKEWAITTGSAIASSEFSAKEYAQGTAATGGTAKEWAQDTSAAVDTTFSAKEYAQGTQASTGGSAKDYATKVDGGVSGATSDHSSKAWSVGGTGVTTTSGKGAAKEWAIASGLVDTASYSSKEYAQGTAASTGGSSKSWAQDTDGVNGAGANDRSAKAWSQGVSMTGATLGGSSKDWANTLVTQIDGTDYSAKENATGVTTALGSAKQWALGGGGSFTEGTVVAGGVYSAKKYASDASASETAAASSATASASSATASAASETAANASVDAISVIYDAFNDTYLGAMADGATQGTNPTPTGTWAKNSSTITVSAGTNIKVGQVVTGTGMPTSPKPNVLSISGTTVILSDNMDAAGSGVTLTFTGYGIYGDFNGTKDGPALNNDGDALADGMLYFNTTDDVVKVYDETTSAWKQIQPTTTEQGHINTVSGIQANVTTVAGIHANVTTVAGIHANVTTVAGVHANVTTVAGSIADVNRYAAEYQIDNFSPSPPSTDGSGASLSDGDLAYDTTANRLKVYEGSAFTNIGLTLAETQLEANNSAVAMAIALG